MVNRWSVLMLVIGAAAGYAAASPSARAQTEPVPFAIGEKVTLRYQHSAEDVGRDYPCLVAALQGTWVRCESTDRFKTPNYETWRSLESLVQVTRYPK
jgi:hypothetical protein